MEVSFPAERLMASAEGFGSSVTGREAKGENLQHYLRDGDASNERGLGNRSSQYLTLDRHAKFEVQKAGRLLKYNDGFTKRPGMVTAEFSKSKAGLLDANRLYLESASSPASCKFSDKTQLIIPKSTSTGRRGLKRNIKPQKSRGDSFSLKNGLVGFHSASGGNDYLGIYGLKHDAFDITRHIDELSLDELLNGSCKFPNFAKDKATDAAGSSGSLLETLAKACLVLEDKKVMHAQKCVDTDDSFIAHVSTSMVTSSSSIGQTNNENGSSCVSELPSFDKVQEPIEKTSTNVADLPLSQPKDVLQRLCLPPQKDLDLLLSDAGKSSSSSRNSTDPHLGKSQRNGLPPLPWSNSSSGNNKLAADAAKISSNRTIFHGKWIKMGTSTALQKSTDDFLGDFESLTYNQSLVPSLTVVSTRSEIEVASMDLVLPASDSFSDVLLSPAHVAAQTLLDIAKSSKHIPFEAIKLIKKPLHIAVKSSKSRLAPERAIKFIDPPRATKLINPPKNSDNGFPSKKLKLPPTVRDGGGTIPHIESARRGHWSGTSSSSLVRSPSKLGRDSSTHGRDSYATDLFKKPFLTRPPRATESPRPSGLHSKFRNSFQ